MWTTSVKFLGFVPLSCYYNHKLGRKFRNKNKSFYPPPYQRLGSIFYVFSFYVFPSFQVGKPIAAAAAAAKVLKFRPRPLLLMRAKLHFVFPFECGKYSVITHTHNRAMTMSFNSETLNWFDVVDLYQVKCLFICGIAAHSHGAESVVTKKEKVPVWLKLH